MRAVVLLLFFAAAFGLAGLWQSRRLERLEHERELAFRLQAGEVGETPSGVLEAGMGMVVIGKRSGVEPIAPVRAANSESDVESDPAATSEVTRDGAPQVEQDTAPIAQPPAQLSDFELAVQPGQTLSSIVREHYGSSEAALVHALATYNGLSNENVLEIGQKLKLPSADSLHR